MPETLSWPQSAAILPSKSGSRLQLQNKNGSYEFIKEKLMSQFDLNSQKRPQNLTNVKEQEAK